MQERHLHEVVPPTHAHRWRIEEPEGELSQGICRICGEQREFRNWLATMDFVTNTEHRFAA